MKPKDRETWILDHLKSYPGERVSITDADFVADYIDATGAAHRVRMWGAHACPQLGRDLLRMKRKYLLKRDRSSIQGMGGLGFPTWVWTYRPHPRLSEEI